MGHRRTTARRPRPPPGPGVPDYRARVTLSPSAELVDPTDPDAARRRSEAVELAVELLRIDSTNGNETAVAEVLATYLADNGVEAELVARDPARANLVARIGGTAGGPSLAFVGHTDVVPADPRDWTHPPFEAVVDDDGYLWGRGAVDMKNEVAARAVAMAELARTGFRPRDDLWFLAVADEEDGFEDVGMRWLLEERTDIRPTHSVNEGGGERLRARPTAARCSGSRSARRAPTRSRSSRSARPATPPCRRWAQRRTPARPSCSPASAAGCPSRAPHPRPRDAAGAARPRRDRPRRALAEADALHAGLGDTILALMGPTMAPTMLWGSNKRNVMPARATVEVDFRILPGTTSRGRERACATLSATTCPTS